MRRVTSMLLVTSAVLAGAAGLYVSQAPAQFASSPFGSGPSGSASGGGDGGVPCGVDEPCAAVSYESTQTDGGAGFTATGFGQVIQGPAPCTGIAVDPATGYNHLGTLACPGVWDLGDTIRFQQGQISLAGQFNLYGSAARLLMARTTLLQCGVEVSEGVTMVDGASGGTTGQRTHECFCTSDGAATPTYAWQNKTTHTVGTATTCPD